MGLTTAGRDVIAAALIAGTYTPFNAANAYIGAGNSSTSFVNSQTDLQGASKLRRGMDAGYPTISGNVLTYRSTFGVTDAQWNWLEVGVFNASSGGQMLSRFIPASLGTKPGTEIWQVTVQLTVVAA